MDVPAVQESQQQQHQTREMNPGPNKRPRLEGSFHPRKCNGRGHQGRPPRRQQQQQHRRHQR